MTDLFTFDTSLVSVPALLESLDPAIVTAVEAMQAGRNIESLFTALNALLDRSLMACSFNPLTSTEVAPREAGIYAIFWERELVYLGSADRLRGRLREHRSSIMSASRLSIEEFYYKYAACNRVAALSAEAQLIPHYKPPWNGLGFGSKANGNGRRHQRKSLWDEKYGREVKR